MQEVHNETHRVEESDDRNFQGRKHPRRKPSCMASETPAAAVTARSVFRELHGFKG